MGAFKRDLFAWHTKHCFEDGDGQWWHHRACPLAVYSEEGRPRFKDELSDEEGSVEGGDEGDDEARRDEQWLTNSR